MIFPVSFWMVFAGNKFHASTSTKYEHDKVLAVPRSDSFTFSVKACNDAHLLLESKPFNNDSSYEVLIGNSGNTKVQILDGPWVCGDSVARQGS